MRITKKSRWSVIGPISILMLGQVAQGAVSPLFAWQTTQVSNRMEKGMVTISGPHGSTVIPAVVRKGSDNMVDSPTDPNYYPVCSPDFTNPEVQPMCDFLTNPVLIPTCPPLTDPQYLPVCNEQTNPIFFPACQTSPFYDQQCTTNPEYQTECGITNPLFDWECATDPQFDPQCQPTNPANDPACRVTLPTWDPLCTTNPQYDPFCQPTNPDYDPTCGVTQPSWDPLCTTNPQYDPFCQPTNPDYDPACRMTHPTWDPFCTTNPLYDVNCLTQPQYDPLCGTSGTEDRPGTFRLGQNHPNPFNPSTRIGFSLPTTGHALLTVHDLGGRRVATLIDGMLGSGYHEVTFDATGISGGVYIYTLVSPGNQQSRKMVVLK